MPFKNGIAARRLQGPGHYSEDANDFINAHFSANPVGVEFDPKDWLARLRAGAPVSDFLVRQVHEPVSPVRGSIASAESEELSS
jgi:hypothetical protein